MSARHGLLVLAAGGSRRLGQAKQLLRIDGETLVHRAARLGLATAPADAVLVLGARADEVAAAVTGLPLRTVVCPDWTIGLGASLRDGLAALSPRCDAALVLLCDQPGLDAAHLHALLAAAAAAPGTAVSSAYAGVLGVPALLPRTWFAALSGLSGDRGARDLLRERASEVKAVPAPALAQDVDVPADLPPMG
ncbi:nucleotidyltransferase family protein [Arenimonas sp. MALMAid1274]|uniref:nucleotidyltransferase family protein n=1 Tax=Arenimonas sp. MALMAid1274 TaxID=3411630 RepID=UPI003BA1340F